MSRLSKEHQSDKYDAGDTRIYGEKISVEFIMCINDMGFGSIMHDSRTRAVTKKTNCHIEVTPRILNKRVNLYRWIKYAIIKITGPDEASLNQCLRLLEKHFPIFQQRKEYSRRANVTIYTNDLNIPDNAPGSTMIMRSGSTMSSCQGLVVRSPFEPDNKRSLVKSPWKVSKPEKRGRYFSTLMCENICQPPLPPHVTSRNLESNSKFYSASSELDKTKINKNKLFGSMGTLSDSLNQGVSTPENPNMKSSQTAKDSEVSVNNLTQVSRPDEGLSNNFTALSKHNEGLLRSGMDNRSIRNFEFRVEIATAKSPGGYHNPLNETIKSSSNHSKFESFSDELTEDRMKLDYVNQDEMLTMVPQERIKVLNQMNKKPISIISDKQSTAFASINRKNVEETNVTPIDSTFQYSANKLSPSASYVTYKDNIGNRLIVLQVPENVGNPSMSNETLYDLPIPKEISNIQVKVNHGLNEVQLSHSMSESITSSVSIKSRVEEPSLALKNNNQNQTMLEKQLISPEKADLLAANINLSYASSKTMPSGSAVVQLINSPSEQMRSPVSYQDTLHAEKDLKFMITSSSIMITQDMTSANQESTPMKMTDSKSSTILSMDEWYYVTQTTTQPTYNAPENSLPKVYERIGKIVEERSLNFNVAESKLSSDNQHNGEVKFNKNTANFRSNESPMLRDSQMSASVSRDSRSPANQLTKDPQINFNISRDTNTPRGNLIGESKTIAMRASGCNVSDSQLDRSSKISIDPSKDFKPMHSRFDDEYKLNMVKKIDKTPHKDAKTYRDTGNKPAVRRSTPKETRTSQKDVNDGQRNFRNSQKDLHGSQNAGRGSQKDFHGSQNAGRGSQKDFHGSQNAGRGSQKDFHGSQNAGRGSQKDFHGSQNAGRGSQKDFWNSQKGLHDNGESLRNDRNSVKNGFHIDRDNRDNMNDMYRNEHMPVDSRATENQSLVPEISTSVVAEDFVNVGNIQIKDLTMEPRGAGTEISPVNFETITSAEIKISVQPVSGVSKSIVVSHSSIETPSGYYVSGINKPSVENQEAVNRAIDMRNDLDILKSISDRLTNPTDGNLILMFDGLDIFSTGQMSMVFKPGNVSKLPMDTDNQLVLFESSHYVITAGFRPGIRHGEDITKGVHAVSHSQFMNPKNG